MKGLKNFYYRFKDTLDWSFYWISLLVLITVPYWFYKGGDYWIWGKENYSLIFISLAGIMKAGMDTLQFHFDNSRFANGDTLLQTFWNPQVSWNNKYKDGKRKKILGIPIPVMFTDGWHLFQSFHINFIILAIVVYTPTYSMFIDFVVYSFLYRAFFFLFYKYFLIKK